ncbi:MAG: calcium/sodium antiporter [Alphaproteobacteria bacterium]
MLTACLAILVGLILLVWSADRFVEGSASTAKYFGMPPLLIGMVIVGFGTSMPEMVVSSLAAFDGNTGISLGNAYGSNIANIALILGISALISPIIVHSSVLRKELPILILVTLGSVVLLLDYNLSRPDAIILLLVFAGLMGWTITQGLKKNKDAMGKDIQAELAETEMPIKKALFWLVVGLTLLIISSRILVWGAVELAELFGISNMIIGLTIVAVGTSLPELASSIIAARKGEHDIALGNIIGSNLFNSLAVVGLAGIIHPFAIEPIVVYRDMVVMSVLTMFLFVICYGFNGRQGRINRYEATTLLFVYFAYTSWLITDVI